MRQLPKVARALAEVRQQAEDYAQALWRRYGAEINLRTYAVVTVGLERILGEEIRQSSDRCSASTRWWSEVERAKTLKAVAEVFFLGQIRNEDIESISFHAG